MLGDLYRSARAKLFLARAYAVTQPSAPPSSESWPRRLPQLGARLSLSAPTFPRSSAVTPANTGADRPGAASDERLAGAATSREASGELVASSIRRRTEPHSHHRAGANGSSRVARAPGYTTEESARVVVALDARNEQERERITREMDASVHLLRGSSAPPATLLVSPRERGALSGGTPIEPLLRVVELGLDVCALRARARNGKDTEKPDSMAGASLMPGFIHSSPAMTRLVDEVHKIRSSDVTVLVTASRGRARSCARRPPRDFCAPNKVVVPLTHAVPKELSEGTCSATARRVHGAVSDSAACFDGAGGTFPRRDRRSALMQPNF